MTTPPHESRRWIATWLIALTGLTATTADQALFSYALADIGKSFGVGLAAMGWVVSASFGLAAIGVVFCGLLTDRIGRRYAFMALLATSALCVGLHAVAQSFTQVAILRILGFAISGGLYPVTTTLVLETAPQRWRGMASGSLQIAYPIGFFVSSIFAAPLLEAGGWRAEFLLGFAVIPIALILGYLIEEPKAFDRVQADPKTQRGLRILFAAPFARTTLVCLIGTFLLNLAISAFIYFIPTFLIQARGFASADAARIAGMAFGIGAIGYILSMLTGQFLLSRRNTFVIWCLLGGLAFGSAIWIAPNRAWLIADLGLAVMFLFGSEAVRMPLIGERYPSEIRATGTAVAGSVGVALGSLVSPVLVTSVQPALGWEQSFTLIGLVPLVIGALAYLLLPNRAAPMPTRLLVPETQPA